MIKWPENYSADDYRRVSNELGCMMDNPGIEEVDTLGLGEAAHMLELIAAAIDAARGDA